MLKSALYLGVASLALLGLSARDAAAQSSSGNAPAGGAPQAAAPAVSSSLHVDLPPLPSGPPTNPDGSKLQSISGTVTSPHGPEAGVWVIAETTELPTKFVKIVVTDDKGRYLLPELPTCRLQRLGARLRPRQFAEGAWRARQASRSRRGAGAQPRGGRAILSGDLLVLDGEDSRRRSVRRQERDPAEGDAAAIPDRRSRTSNASAAISSASLRRARSPPPSAISISSRPGSAASNPAKSATQMVGAAGSMGGVPLHYFADWTERVAKGELPSEKPQRPQGVERNIVITEWEWGSPSTYLHDLISTDKRNPTVNAYGPLFGSTEYSTDDLPILDPKTNTASTFHAPHRDADMPESLGPGQAADLKPMQASAYWGDQKMWTNHVNNHNSMFDSQGRLWLTVRLRVTRPIPPIASRAPILNPRRSFR